MKQRLDVQAFIAGCSDAEPPSGMEPSLEALWRARKGDWDHAHEIVMANDADVDCAWVHAYLHRVEGDISNAHYWYRRANKTPQSGPLEGEWESIVTSLLEHIARREHGGR